MKSYYLMFYNGDKKVCVICKRAYSEEEACMMAEFDLMCRYPNVKYTSCEVILTEVE